MAKVEEMKVLAENMLQMTRHFVEEGMEILPTAFFYEPNGELSIVGLAGDDKKGHIAFMNNKCRDGSAVVFIADSWVTHIAATETTRTEALRIAIFGTGIDKQVDGIQPYERNGEKIIWQELEWLPKSSSLAYRSANAELN